MKFRGTPLPPKKADFDRKMVKKWSPFVVGILNMTLKGLGEMFEGYSAEMCAGNIPLVPMGG